MAFTVVTGNGKGAKQRQRALDQSADGASTVAEMRQALIQAVHAGKSYSRHAPSGMGNYLMECWGCGQWTFDRASQSCTHVGKCRKALGPRGSPSRVGGWQWTGPGPTTPKKQGTAIPELMGIKLPPTMREPLAASVSKAKTLAETEKQRQHPQGKTPDPPAARSAGGPAETLEGEAACRDFLAKLAPEVRASPPLQALAQAFGVAEDEAILTPEMPDDDWLTAVAVSFAGDSGQEVVDDAKLKLQQLFADLVGQPSSASAPPAPGPPPSADRTVTARQAFNEARDVADKMTKQLLANEQELDQLQDKMEFTRAKWDSSAKHWTQQRMKPMSVGRPWRRPRWAPPAPPENGA